VKRRRRGGKIVGREGGREREGDKEKGGVETYIAGLLLHLLLADGFLIVLVNVDLWLLLFLFLSG